MSRCSTCSAAHASAGSFPKRAIADAKYGTIENIRCLEDAGIRAFVPIPDLDKRTEYYGPVSLPL